MGVKERLQNLRGAGYRKVQEWNANRAEESREKKALKDLEDTRYKETLHTERRKAAEEIGELRAKKEAGLVKYKVEREYAEKKRALSRRESPRSIRSDLAWDVSGMGFGGDISSSILPMGSGKQKGMNMNKVILPFSVNQPRQTYRHYKHGKKPKHIRQPRQPQGFDMNSVILPQVSKKTKKFNELWW